jgi:hypothetical protein
MLYSFTHYDRCTHTCVYLVDHSFVECQGDYTGAVCQKQLLRLFSASPCAATAQSKAVLLVISVSVFVHFGVACLVGAACRRAQTGSQTLLRGSRGSAQSALW